MFEVINCSCFSTIVCLSCFLQQQICGIFSCRDNSWHPLYHTNNPLTIPDMFTKFPPIHTIVWLPVFHIQYSRLEMCIHKLCQLCLLRKYRSCALGCIHKFIKIFGVTKQKFLGILWSKLKSIHRIYCYIPTWGTLHMACQVFAWWVWSFSQETQQNCCIGLQHKVLLTMQAWG